MGQTITGTIHDKMTAYRSEAIMGFERKGGNLANSVTTETMKKGSSLVFVVKDSGSATAVTRGFDGNIVPRAMNNNQVTLDLSEWHDLPRMTGFNVFTSQDENVRFAMYDTAYNVIARRRDDQIVTALNTATQGPTNTAVSDAFGLLMNGLELLGRSNVPTDDGNVYAAVSHSFMNNLQKVKEFSNAEYVSQKTFDDGVQSPNKMWRWNGINIIVFNNLPGVGTSEERCFIYHKNAIGHAIDNESFDISVGYNDEQAYSYVRASANMGAKLLQNTGVKILKHIGNTVAAATMT